MADPMDDYFERYLKSIMGGAPPPPPTPVQPTPPPPQPQAPGSVALPQVTPPNVTLNAPSGVPGQDQSSYKDRFLKALGDPSLQPKQQAPNAKYALGVASGNIATELLKQILKGKKGQTTGPSIPGVPSVPLPKPGSLPPIGGNPPRGGGNPPPQIPGREPGDQPPVDPGDRPTLGPDGGGMPWPGQPDVPLYPPDGGQIPGQPDPYPNVPGIDPGDLPPPGSLPYGGGGGDGDDGGGPIITYPDYPDWGYGEGYGVGGKMIGGGAEGGGWGGGGGEDYNDWLFRIFAGEYNEE